MSRQIYMIFFLQASAAPNTARPAKTLYIISQVQKSNIFFSLHTKAPDLYRIRIYEFQLSSFLSKEFYCKYNAFENGFYLQ